MDYRRLLRNAVDVLVQKTREKVPVRLCESLWGSTWTEGAFSQTAPLREASADFDSNELRPYT